MTSQERRPATTRRMWLVAPALSLALVIGALPLALPTYAAGRTYSGCISVYGELEQPQVGTGASCANGTKIIWQEQGATGATGPAGPPGMT